MCEVEGLGTNRIYYWESPDILVLHVVSTQNFSRRDFLHIKTV